MSDQSKPAGQRLAVASEWTADYVRNLKETRGYITTEEGWKAIAYAHNAALAAAYKKGMEDEYEQLRKAGCLDVCP